MTSPRIWFWVCYPNPLISSLIASIVELDAEVRVLGGAYGGIEDRRQLGWPADVAVNSPVVRLGNAGEAAELAGKAPPGVVHIFEGLRAPGFTAAAQRALRRSSGRYWAMLEKPDTRGWVGGPKKILYRRVVAAADGALDGILAIGSPAERWLIDRGAKPDRTFPFAYFIDPPSAAQSGDRPATERRKICFVGQLVPRKGIDLLLRAAAMLPEPFEIEIIGRGEKEAELRALAHSLIPGSVTFRGALPRDQIFNALTEADFLVLPSRFDGWGSVVVEALMVGTPVICSDTCGAADAVRASGGGFVFRSGNVESLAEALALAQRWQPSAQDRAKLARWARCFSGQAGAAYLLEILSEPPAKPVAPWAREPLCLSDRPETTDIVASTETL